MSALSSSPFAAHVGKHPGEPNVMEAGAAHRPVRGLWRAARAGPGRTGPVHGRLTGLVRDALRGGPPSPARPAVREQSGLAAPGPVGRGEPADQADGHAGSPGASPRLHARVDSQLRRPRPHPAAPSGVTRVHGQEDHRSAAACRADRRRTAGPAPRIRRGRRRRSHPALRLPPADHRHLRTGRHTRSGPSAVAGVGYRPPLDGPGPARLNVPGDDRAHPSDGPGAARRAHR